MARAMRRIRGVSLAATLLFAEVGSARAQPPAVGESAAESPAFRLVYAAPAACPDRDAFVVGIRARTSRPRLVTGDEAEGATALRVAIAREHAGEGASGLLELREPDGTEETRRVSGQTCEEVANALALVAAVMLDPEAGRDGAPAPEPEPRRPLPAPPASPARSPTAPAPPHAEGERRERWLFAAGAELGISGGIGPALAAAAGVFGDVEHLARRTGLASTLRVTVAGATTSSALRAGTQTYEWLAAAIRLCPAYLALPARLRIAPCAGFQAGGHRGTTRDVRSPTAHLQAWLAPTASGTVEWAISPAVSLELEGGALFPLRRSRFFLAPNSTIFEVPGVAGRLALGVRVRFL